MDEVRILIADDDREIRDLLKKYLERELYHADVATDGEHALRLFDASSYNLVILDIMMPLVDGIEVCRRLRNKSNVPILMLTAKDHEAEKILGLSIGADDYMTKPFSINEVVARVKALMRRYLILGSEQGTQSKTKITYKGLSIDLRQYTVNAGGEEVPLTSKDLNCLSFSRLIRDRYLPRPSYFVMYGTAAT